MRGIPRAEGKERAGTVYVFTGYFLSDEWLEGILLTVTGGGEAVVVEVR